MRRRAGGRLQMVGAGMLVLALTVAAPALSTAQQEPAVAEEPAASATGETGGSTAPETGEATDPVAEEITAAASSETAPAAPAEPPALRSAKTAATEVVSVGDNFYLPGTVEISVGDKITWRNDGAAPHTATADNGSFDTGTFQPGQSRSKSFNTAGTIPYYCTIHGQAQSGTIKVIASSSGGGGGGGGTGGGGTATTSDSEAAAVSSPGAAGSSTSLPATGLAAIVLAAIGLGLIGSGSSLRRLERRRPRGRFFSL